MYVCMGVLTGLNAFLSSHVCISFFILKLACELFPEYEFGVTFNQGTDEQEE